MTSPPLALSRRHALEAAASGLGGALLARIASPSRALAAPARAPLAKACVVLWMNGGPSHIDTFDPKPGARTGGPFKAIKTRVKGLEFCEHLPLLAEQAHHLCVVRGMSSKEGNHDRARYLLHTGYAPTPTVTHPSLGGWVSEAAASPSGLPAFVSLGGPSAGAGFLGVQHGPFVVPKGGAPRDVDPPPRVDASRFQGRMRLLDTLEARFAAETGDPQIAGRRAVYAQAVRLMRSPDLGAFDPANEPAALPKAYGDTDFGRACLTARKLVQAGVRLVEVTLDGWDTHQDNFTRVKKQCSVLDPAFAALVADLHAHKLLASTLVVCLGEFGRSPRIGDDDGRDHHPQAWSCVAAGGGLRAGLVHGATDADGAKVVAGATSVADLFATLTSRLGIDPARTIYTPAGRPITVTDHGAPIQALIA